MRLALTIAAALLASTAASAVTLVNGSFEDGGPIGGDGFETLATGDTSITGWTVLSDGVDYIGSFWAASEGSRSLDLSALTSGGVKQTVSGFEAGKTYVVKFDVSANFSGGADLKKFVMSATGGEAYIDSYTRTAANSASSMLWQTYTYTFTASAAVQDIQFRSLEENPSGIALDNVSISQVSSLVPEPAAWALLIAGFGMTGVALRGRRALKAVVA